jgi:hypothetical protein
VKNLLKKQIEKTAQDNLSTWLRTQTRQIEGERDDAASTGTCSICGTVLKRWERWGNNAEPINSGRCCDECNALVIMRRIQLAQQTN